MADDRTNRATRGRARVDVNQDYELRDWSERFGVSQDELRRAVEKVGPMADDVEGWLKRHKKAGESFDY